MPCKYLIANAWNHIFEGRTPSEVRFVFNVAEETISHMQICTHEGWEAAMRQQAEDVLDSLLNANPEALDYPGNYGLTKSNHLPAWAAPVPQKKPTKKIR